MDLSNEVALSTASLILNAGKTTANLAVTNCQDCPMYAAEYLDCNHPESTYTPLHSESPMFDSCPLKKESLTISLNPISPTPHP